jgi:hypothetical protein
VAAVSAPGGFTVSTDSAHKYKNVTWTALGAPFVAWPSDGTGRAASGLTPNTRYYMQTYFGYTNGTLSENSHYREGIWPETGYDEEGWRILESRTVPFCTLPEISSATAIEGGWPTQAAIDAAFTKGADPGALAISGVTIYYSETDATNGLATDAAVYDVLAPSLSASDVRYATLTKGDGAGEFSDAGFTGYKLELPEENKEYDVCVVLENENGDHAFYFLGPYQTKKSAGINVSVPVKMLFAAFESEEGKVTSPVYKIKNNNTKAGVKVTLMEFVPRDLDQLILTPAATALMLKPNEISLRLSGPAVDFGTTGFLEPQGGQTAIPTPGGEMGTLNAATGENSSTDGSFTIDGTYMGDFLPARFPVFDAVFKFELAD